MTALALSRLHFPVTALGPGNRIGIWFQGCSLRCPGCISADTWRHGLGMTSVENVMAAIRPWFADADGITVSGGEPFEQPQALRDLLTQVRNEFSGDILVYTGRERAEVEAELSSISGCVDALIDGAYREDKSDNLPLRGSDNQEIHLLTELGRLRFGRWLNHAEAGKKSFDVMFGDEGEIWFVGIPSRGDFEMFRQLLANDGSRVSISDDRSLQHGAFSPAGERQR